MSDGLMSNNSISHLYYKATGGDFQVPILRNKPKNREMVDRLATNDAMVVQKMMRAPGLDAYFHVVKVLFERQQVTGDPH